MLMYRYRWLAAVGCGFLIMAFGYVIDVRDMLSEYAGLLTREAIIKNQLVRQAQPVHANNIEDTFLDNKPVTPIRLREFMRLSSANEIEIISLVNLDSGSESDPESAVFQFVLNADYARLINFLRNVVEANEEYSIGDLEIHGLPNNRVSLALSLSISGGASETNNFLKIVNSENNPFCDSAPSGLFGQSNFNEVMRYPLQDIRFIGVVRVMNRSEAVLLFPDGVVKTLTIHARIGKEGGEIEKIESTKMVVIMPDHARRVLSKNIYN